MPTTGAPSSRRRLLFILLWLVFMAVLIEGTSRFFWANHLHASITNLGDPETAFYPELYHVLHVHPSSHDSIIDVLLLGGSTVSTDFGSVPQALAERLTQATNRKVQVFSLGRPAHTSRDSYYKYRALSGVRFDAVVLYDGFNELRANNAPPAMFRDDYTHFAWYHLVQDVLDRHALTPLATPYTITFALRNLRERLAELHGTRTMVDMDAPDTAWTRYGTDIRTAGPLRRNMEAILDLARQRQEPAIIMTFAAWFAPGYSYERMKAGRLAYTTHRTPLELWGRPDALVAGLAVHNAAIRALHADRPDVGFVDMASAIPGERRYWNDACHLTVEGADRFADALVPAILARITVPPGPPPISH